MKTYIRIDEFDGKKKKHYKSVSLNGRGLKAWRALVIGTRSVYNIDLNALRSKRKRRGGR